MKVYEAIFDEDKMTGVYGISLVENPAMQDHWITLSEHKLELQAVNEDKRLLLGAALIPDKKMYRKIDKLEFFLTFSKETIEKLAHAYNKNLYHNNTTYEHKYSLSNLTLVENWIVEDPKNDKSNVYGKEYPKGTWVNMLKVDDDKIWQKAKKGDVKGISIEAVTGIQKLNLNKLTKMENKEETKSITEAIKSGFESLFNMQKEKQNKEEIKQVDVKAQMTEDEAKEVLKGIITEILEELKSSETKEEEPSEQELEMSKQLTEKEKEIETLKTELSKVPEVEAIKSKPEVSNQTIELSKANTTKERARMNIAKHMNWA